MTLYARVEDNTIVEYPYDLDNLRRYISMPSEPSAELLAEHGVILVEETPRPQTDYTQNVIELDPENVDGAWLQAWGIVAASKKEVDARVSEQISKVKSKRNFLLQESDWTQLPDSPVDKELWAAYRKNLREIELQVFYPWEVEWPTPPGT